MSNKNNVLQIMYDYFKKKYLYIDIKDFYCEVSVFMLLSQI